MTFKHIYIFFFLMVVFNNPSENNNSTTQNSIVLKTSKTAFVAGASIFLEFSVSKPIEANLICTNSYGTTVIKSQTETSILLFKIPELFCSKSGILNWELLTDTSTLNGQLYISPSDLASSIENYIGPPSIEAGGADFAMLVSIPTDPFDNPLTDGTSVQCSEQFLSTITTESIEVRNMIAYNTIYSKQESGRLLVASECLGLNSKEHTIMVSPAIPSQFTIQADRPHDFADGNQITSFETSVIKDKNNNVVSDGTYVQFYIETHDHRMLQTSGLTVNGIAKAQMIHPDRQSSWIVKAFIEGIADSNEIRLKYQPVISDFQFSVSNNGRTVTVGPFKSFMNQLIPDGLEVTLRLSLNNTSILQELKASKDGYVSFTLQEDIVPKDYYDIEIEAAGIKKQVTHVSVW